MDADLVGILVGDIMGPGVSVGEGAGESDGGASSPSSGVGDCYFGAGGGRDDGSNLVQDVSLRFFCLFGWWELGGGCDFGDFEGVGIGGANDLSVLGLLLKVRGIYESLRNLPRGCQRCLAYQV